MRWSWIRPTLTITILSLLNFLRAADPASQPDSAPAQRNVSPADSTVRELRRLLKNESLSPADAQTLRDALTRLQQQETRENLSEENSQLATRLRADLEKKYADHPHNRGYALLLTRFLLFLDDVPAALKIMENLHPASAADIAWPLTMADIYLRLGDSRKALIYTSQAEKLLRTDSSLSLGNPVAVTNVNGFRIYTPDPRTSFPPGGQIILYVEIDGARFNVRGNEWQCQLDFGLELLNGERGVCDKNTDYGRYDPVYNGNVREIHASLYYRIPADLPAGRYTLRIYCKDVVAGTPARTDFALNVGGVSERKDLQQERKVDAEAYQKILDNNLDPLAPDNSTGIKDILEGWGNGKTSDKNDDLKKKYRLQGLGISRERSKMQGGLFNQ